MITEKLCHYLYYLVCRITRHLKNQRSLRSTSGELNFIKIAILKMLCCFQFVWEINMDLLLGRIISSKLHSHPPSWRRDLPVTFKKLLLLKSISRCNILPYCLQNVLVFTQVLFIKTATKVLKILRWYLASSSPPWFNSFPYCIVHWILHASLLWLIGNRSPNGKHSIALTKLIPDHC